MVVTRDERPFEKSRLCWLVLQQANVLSLQTIKYWDLRAPNPVATVQLPERCYSKTDSFEHIRRSSHFLVFTLTFYLLIIAMDVAYPLMVVGTAERHIQF